MREAPDPFFGGRVVDRIVRNGADVQLSCAAHTYCAMILQIALDYPGLPDVRTLSVAEVVFFYNGMRAQLKKHSRGRVGK